MEEEEEKEDEKGRKIKEGMLRVTVKQQSVFRG